MKFYTLKELEKELVSISKIPDQPFMSPDIQFKMKDEVQKEKDHHDLKKLRLKYFHTSHVMHHIANKPYKKSVSDKPSRKIIRS
jgi:hypothetical protein